MGRKYQAILLISYLLATVVFTGCLNSGTSGGSTGLGHTDKVHPRLEAEDLLNYEKSIEEILGSGKVDKDKLSVLIEKSQYRLTVLYEGEPIKQYPVVFGGNNTDDKRMQGDGRVPEGTFKIKDLYPHDTWSRFIWIDYPNEESWRKYNQAKEEGLIPEDASIGGDIGIHGVPAGEDYLIDEGTDWTAGCTGMKRADVEELYNIVQVETVVEIVK